LQQSHNSSLDSGKIGHCLSTLLDGNANECAGAWIAGGVVKAGDAASFDMPEHLWDLGMLLIMMVVSSKGLVSLKAQKDKRFHGALVNDLSIVSSSWRSWSFFAN
jgi:hypothetical protein